MNHVRRARGRRTGYQPIGSIQAFVVDSDGCLQRRCLRTWNASTWGWWIAAGIGESLGAVERRRGGLYRPVGARCFGNDGSASIAIGSNDPTCRADRIRCTIIRVDRENVGRRRQLDHGACQISYVWNRRERSDRQELTRILQIFNGNRAWNDGEREKGFRRGCN
jgi:hypothetical protein